MKKSAFTLVETIITIVIMSILMGIIFEIFLVISHISIFTQYQKTVHNEIIFVMQTIQNLVDDQSVIMTGFDLSPSGDAATYGYKTTLSLMDDNFTYTVSRLCDTPSACYLNLYRRPIEYTPGNPDDEALVVNAPLTDSDLVHVTNFYIKSLPFNPETGFEYYMHEGFRFFLGLRIPQYTTEKRWFQIEYDLQSFFTIRKY